MDGEGGLQKSKTFSPSQNTAPGCEGLYSLGYRFSLSTDLIRGGRGHGYAPGVLHGERDRLTLSVRRLGSDLRDLTRTHSRPS